MYINSYNLTFDEPVLAHTLPAVLADMNILKRVEKMLSATDACSQMVGWSTNDREARALPVPYLHRASFQCHCDNDQDGQVKYGVLAQSATRTRRMDLD